MAALLADEVLIARHAFARTIELQYYDREHSLNKNKSTDEFNYLFFFTTFLRGFKCYSRRLCSGLSSVSL